MTGSRALVLVATCLAGAAFILSGSGVRSEYSRVKLHSSGTTVVDPRLDATLSQIRRIAETRDLEALARFTGPAFFWEQDFGGSFDRRASAIPNLVAALSLDDSELAPEYRGLGWARLAALVSSRTRMRHPYRKGIVCVPGEPSYADPAQARRTFHQAGAAAGGDWGWVEDEVAVRAASAASAETVATLADEAVRVLDWSATGWVKVETADGETGFVPRSDLWPLSPERLCFRRNADGAWKIVGYRGGGD